MSINARDVNVSILLSLHLVNFFFFFVISSNFLTIPVVREKDKVKLALAIPTGAPTIVANEIIDTPPVVALKTSKILSM